MPPATKETLSALPPDGEIDKYKFIRQGETIVFEEKNGHDENGRPWTHKIIAEEIGTTLQEVSDAGCLTISQEDNNEVIFVIGNSNELGNPYRGTQRDETVRLLADILEGTNIGVVGL